MSSAHIVDSYTFNKTAKTIKFNDYGSIRLEGIKLITNVDTGTIIYQFNSATLGGTVSNNVLTLDYNTAAMSDSHKLMIIYEAPEPRSILSGMAVLLERIINLIRRPEWTTQSAIGPMVKVSLDQHVGNMTGITVGALSNMNGFNGIDSRWLLWETWNQAYRLGIRSRIN